MTEKPLVFSSRGQMLYGILHTPENVAARGVLIVVGGPQTRVGSHRQFVLLARELAAAGIPCFRFDYTGMGDSSGPLTTFEDIEADIRSAIDVFFTQQPHLRDVVIWGLCDAASAAMFYAHKDSRVGGLALANPWVRTEAGMAKAYLKTYYLQRVLDPALWRKILRGQFQFMGALKSFLGMAASARKTQLEPTQTNSPTPTSAATTQALPDRMAQGWEAFNGPTLIILSGDDLTAAEFKNLLAGSKRWQKLWKQKSPTRRDLPEATHTFSRKEWRDRVSRWTIDWVQSL